MPFTPLHMGPGVLVKAVLQGSFSLMVFGWAQILMDIQPLLVMLTGEGHLHGFTHTYIGATLIAPAAALSGKYLGDFGLRVLQLPQYIPIPWPAAWLSAFIGSYSHVVLDSIMHADIRPLSPFSDSNILFRVISLADLHWFCVIAAIVGAALYFAVSAVLSGRRDKAL